MIALVVKDYDDQNIAEDCEAGWRRLCSEVLVRTHYHLVELCRRHRRLGRFGMQPSSRREWEDLRRQIASYRWVFCGTGGEFTFEQTCEDVGLDPELVRRQLLSQCRPRRDINLLVDWVVRQEKSQDMRSRTCSRRRASEPFNLVDAVREFRSEHADREGRRGAQTHAVCRYGRKR